MIWMMIRVRRTSRLALGHLEKLEESGYWGEGKGRRAHVSLHGLAAYASCPAIRGRHAQDMGPEWRDPIQFGSCLQAQALAAVLGSWPLGEVLGREAGQ